MKEPRGAARPCALSAGGRGDPEADFVLVALSREDVDEVLVLLERLHEALVTALRTVH